MLTPQNRAPGQGRSLSLVDPMSDGKVLQLVRKTAAADATDEEFEVFRATCQALRLDPRRKQAYCLVYNKKNPKKRRMSIIVGIDGFRTVAARTGDYRPDENEPEYVYDENAKNPITNPLGLVKALVKVWRYSHGEWHQITGVAYWDEYAPISEVWSEDRETGERKPTGKKTLDGMWPTRPRGQLAKCAEALALRKGWPDDFSNVYAEEEVDRSRLLDLTATEIMEETARAERKALLGGPSILVDWCDGEPLEAVPVGRFTDRFLEFQQSCLAEDDFEWLVLWEDRNRMGLREFWAHNSGEGLEIKRHLEEARKGAESRRAEEAKQDEKP